MWTVIQTAIFIAVAWGNIYFGWTQNGWLVGILAFGAAWLLTVFPFKVYDFVAYRIVPLFRRDRHRILPPGGVLKEPVFPASPKRRIRR